MSFTKFDPRQATSRDILQQLIPNLAGQELDNLLRSIDKELQPPLRLDASNPPSRSISIGPSIISNPESGRKKSVPITTNGMPYFSGGTITFPAASGGLVDLNPGTDVTLTVSPNNYIKGTISVDYAGNLSIEFGVQNTVEANATVVSAPVGRLPAGFVSLFNNAGTIEVVEQSDLYQFNVGSNPGNGPVAINKYEADSVASQVNIPNSGPLPFSVDLSRKENLFLYVNGRYLREGASNDYVFTDSTHIQLNAPIVAGLNIVVIWLKPSDIMLDELLAHMPDTSTHGISSFILGSTESQFFSNKTTDILTFQEQAVSPASPSAGNQKIYAKTDGKMYKKKSDGTESELGGNPPGVILAFGGITAPQGYLMCDGASLLRTAYPDLFASIGTAYGAVDGTHFNVPDFRGMFLRGADNGAGIDPDAASRTASPGGNSGDQVGSKQSDAFSSHSHSIQLTNDSGVNGSHPMCRADIGGPSFGSGSAGGSETRPKNVYVNYIIKY